MGKLIVFTQDMPKNVPISSREFADIFLLIVQFKLHLIRDVCTLCVGALVWNSVLHALLYQIKEM